MTKEEGFERALRDALGGREAATPCPGEEALLAFYGGALSEERAESIREHLADCASCVGLATDARRFLGAMRGAAASGIPRAGSLVWLAAAAGLAAAILAGLWVLQQRPAVATLGAPKASVQRPPKSWRDLPVAAPAYRPSAPEDELVFRSGDEGSGGEFAQAMIPYMRGDFSASESGLARFLEAHPDHAEALLYRGVSLLMLGRPAEARPLLASARSAVPSPAEAGWYLALALLKSGDTPAALVELETVARAQGPHRAEAARLGDEVRRALGSR